MGRPRLFQIVPCQICDSPVKSLPSRQRKFCSSTCAGIGHRGSNNYRFKSGSIDGCGYRVIYVDGKKILEHRHVMQSHLGRPLRRDEIVHHVDENKLNNDISNLQLLDRASHALLHSGFNVSRTHKRCPTCDTVLHITNFYTNRSTADKLSPECKECRKHRERARRLATSPST